MHLDSKSCEFQWERGRLFDHTAAVILYEMCMEDPTATVLKVSHTSSGGESARPDAASASGARLCLFSAPITRVASLGANGGQPQL